MADSPAPAKAPSNRDLADRARTLADEQVADSLARRAAICVAVCLREAKTIAAARRLLVHIRPDLVREAATELFDRLTTETP